MKCPYCGDELNRVTDSRPIEETNAIRRRRICEGCGRRFTTYETVETIPLTVIKKDQNREPYSRSKLENGILRACYKRPVPLEKVEELMEDDYGMIDGIINNGSRKDDDPSRKPSVLEKLEEKKQ